jgi:hypothetical protein
VSPRVLLILLIAIGGAAAWWLAPIRPIPADSTLTSATDTSASAPSPAISLLPTTPALDADAEIRRLEEMVEHLEMQNKALSEENASLIQKLGMLGMNQKGATPAPVLSPPTLAEDDTDYVALGTELLKRRELQNLPIPAITSNEEEVKEVILTWLRKIHGADHGTREGAALFALGVIPELIDTITPRASLMARRVTGWYDEETGTLMVIPPHREPGGTLVSTEPPLAIAYGNLLHHFGDSLFGPEYARLTSDERHARLALIGGDAGLTRFLHSLANPAAPAVDEVTLPVDDPDHPLNQIPVPDYLRQRDLLPMTHGFEFVQTLHSIGSWPQVAAAYQRLPESTAEIMDSERYLGDTRLPPVPVSVKNSVWRGTEPSWDDRLGQHTLLLYLRRYLEFSEALTAAATWRGDRFLAYTAGGSQTRGSAHWHIVTASTESATSLQSALRSAVLQHYGLPQDTKLPHQTADGRAINVTLEKQTVLLTDEAS